MDVIKPEKTPIGYMFDCVLDSIKKDNNGHTYITIKTHSDIQEDIFDLFNKPLNCALKLQKAKRSNNANAYCWELCAQIAAVIKEGSIDVYKEAIRNRGIYKDYEVPNDQVNEVTENWSALGIGWFTETVDQAGEDSVILRCYYGTSTYDSAQMCEVISFLSEEAKDLGITVLSERKKNELINNWRSAAEIKE